MDQKTKIQYVGQFYVYGTEALKPAVKEPKKAKTSLPKHMPLKNVTVRIDTVLILGIAAALVAAVVLISGFIQMQDGLKNYEMMNSYVSSLREENAKLAHDYRSSYDLEEIRTAAESRGMIPAEEAETMTIRLTMPEEKTEETWFGEAKWFLSGLLKRSE